MTKLYFEKYKDTCFAPEDIISFCEALKLYETICDNELIELIKLNGIRIFDVKKSVVDPKTGLRKVYCEEIHFNELEEEYLVKYKTMLREEVDKLSDQYPHLMMKNFPLDNSFKTESEVDNLKKIIEQLEALITLKDKELEEHRKKLKTIHAQAGISETTATKWSGYVENAVRLASHCIKNPQKRTDDELKELCSQLGIKLNTEAMLAFRRGLPEEYRCKRGESRSADNPPNPKN